MKTSLQKNRKTIKSLAVGAVLSLASLTSNAQCSADFSYTIGMGGNVSVVSTSLGTTPSTTYQWQFANGTPITGSTSSFAFTYNGYYSVILTITDLVSGCTSTINRQIKITNAALLACTSSYDFVTNDGTHPILNALGEVEFYNFSSGITSTTVFNWNFGDGTISTLDNPTHKYLTDGSYNVTMFLEDSANGCIDTIGTWRNIIIGCVAQANFGLWRDTTLTPTWNAYPAYPVTTQSAVWSWGDGTSTTGLYPTHTYANAGMYNICLTITDSCGATDSMCINQNIYRLANSQVPITINVKHSATPTSVKNLLNTSVASIYPNPNNGSFTITEPTQGTYTIVNELGQVVSAFTGTTANVSNLPSGMYFLIGNNGNHVTRQKIVVTQ
jgi:PKD repeat protein